MLRGGSGNENSIWASIESSQNGSPVTRSASMLDGKSTSLDGMIIGQFLPLRDRTPGAPMIVPAHR